MDVKYAEGDVPWLLSLGDHSNARTSPKTSELQRIARRHSFEPLYQPLNTSANDSKWNNTSVFFGKSTTDLNSNEHHRTNIHDDYTHTFCYLCSINQHTHERTKPRDESKRRKLIPYKNPKARSSSLSTDRGLREPSSSSSDLIPYRFIVRTDSRKNSGTRAQVFLYLYGTEKDWTSIHLRGSHLTNSSTSTDGFTRGSIRTFCLKGPDIGQLHHLNVNLVGCRSDKEWFLKEIEITNLTTAVTWFCEFNCWLPKVQDQGTSHVKPTIHRPVDFSLSVYILQIRTGDKPFAGTDAKIQIKIHGSTSQTRRLTLTSQQANLFERNQLDTFAIVGGDLGDLQEIIVESDKSHHAADWDVKEMMMWQIIPKNDHQRTYVYFPFNSWLGKKASMLKSKREVYPSKNQEIRGPVCYEVIVKTGKAMNAGTDANVFLIIYGTNGRTVIHPLNNRLKNDFERNSTSEFTIMDIDVGQIDRIKIWHDNPNPGSAWFLDSVLIHKKYSTSRTVSNLYVQRVEQISQALYGQMKSAPSQNLTSKDSFDGGSIDRLGSNRGILRSPTMYDKISLQKKVTWDEYSISSQDDLPRVKTLQTKSEPRHRKEDALPRQTEPFDHQVYWISSHSYADKKWKIKSIEEVHSLGIDQRTRSLLLSDRGTTNNQMNKSTAAIDDEIYEFQANRWLAKDKEDGKLEIDLIPKSIHKPSGSTVDSKKIHPQHQKNDEKENLQDVRRSSPYDRKSMERSSKDFVSQEIRPPISRSPVSSRTHLNDLQHPSERSIHSLSRQDQQESPIGNSPRDKFPRSPPLIQPLRSPRNIDDRRSPLNSERELLNRITGEPSHHPKPTGSGTLLSNQSLKPTRESLGSISHRPPIASLSSNQRVKSPGSTSERDVLTHRSNDLITPLSRNRDSLGRFSHEPPSYSRATTDSSKPSSTPRLQSLHSSNELGNVFNAEEELLARLIGAPALHHSRSSNASLTSISPRTRPSRNPNESVSSLINERKTVDNPPDEARNQLRSSLTSTSFAKSSQSTRTSVEPPTRSKLITPTHFEMSSKKSISNQIYKSAYGTASPDDF